MLAGLASVGFRGKMVAMRFVATHGSPFERGAQTGEAFAEAIGRSVAFNRRYLTRHGLAHDGLETILLPYLEASRRALPHLVEQIEGMAEGAGAPFLDLFFANAFEEVYGILELGLPQPAPLERCTDVAVGAPGGTLLGHTEQWYAGDDGEVGVVLDVPHDGPALLAPVVAGTLPLVGINAFGGSFGAMSLSAGDERVGVPRSLVARDVLDARDRADAVARATRDDRAGGYSYLCAFPDGDVVAIESTATTAAVLEVREHTNHALDPSVAAAALPPSEGSRSRLARAHQLGPAAAPTVEGLASVLADHDGAADAICAHPDPRDGEEASTILFAMICEPGTRTMWVTPGHACTGTFERFAIPER